MGPIVIATPHPRHNLMEQRLAKLLPGVRVIRVRNREELTEATLAPLAPEFVFLPHWSWMVPSGVYQRFNCVIFHMTNLPYGRGGSPLQNLIVRGHESTTLSAIRCVKEVDAGPVFMKRPLSLAGTAEEILRRASDLSAEMIVEIVRTRPVPNAQEGEVVRFERRRPEDGNLSSLADLKQVHDYIRMLDGEGYPPAFLDTPHLHMEFTDSRVLGEIVEATVRIRRRTS